MKKTYLTSFQVSILRKYNTQYFLKNLFLSLKLHKVQSLRILPENVIEEFVICL